MVTSIKYSSFGNISLIEENQASISLAIFFSLTVPKLRMVHLFPILKWSFNANDKFGYICFFIH